MRFGLLKDALLRAASGFPDRREREEEFEGVVAGVELSDGGSYEEEEDEEEDDGL